MNSEDREKLASLKNEELKIRLNNSIKNIEEAIKYIMDIDYLYIDKYDGDGLTTALHILVDKRQALYRIREETK